MENWEREALLEAEKELLQENPITQFFEIVQFQSRSKGRGRKRKSLQKVILIRPRGGKMFFFWDGESDCSLPWDEWATEVFALSRGKYLGDILRLEIKELLDKFPKI